MRESETSITRGKIIISDLQIIVNANIIRSTVQLSIARYAKDSCSKRIVMCVRLKTFDQTYFKGLKTINCFLIMSNRAIFMNL